MGCICSKGTRANQYVENNHAKDKHKEKTKTSKHVASAVNENAVVEADGGGNDATARLISNHPENAVGSTPVSSDEGKKKAVADVEKPSRSQLQRRSTMETGSVGRRITRITSISNGERGAQIIAGWPSWLTAVAGEAINGWVPRKADSFEKLDKIGQGTYSSVYKARDLETNKLVALKKVRFANMDPESVRFMAREIIILRRLDHPNVMKLEGLITSRVSGSLYLVFEYMDHDLAGLAALPGVKFCEAQIKCYMKQLLYGLEHCHSRGVLHRDIKGSNLLIDYNGNLKIGDFGLSTSFHPRDSKQPLTSRVVTLWYRPPELLLGATDYGVAVDIWSAGCILAELFYGKPIMPGRTEVEQLHKIFKLCGSPSEEYWKRSKLPHATIFKPQHPYKRCIAEMFKDIPSSTLALLEVLLAVEPESRGTASSALQSEFFTTNPLPCDPSNLPKYPPSKEFDAKLREEETRRQKAAIGKGQAREIRKDSRDSQAVPAPDANAELQASIQKHKGQSNPISVSEKFNHDEDRDSSFPIESRKVTGQNGYSHSGQSVHQSAFGSQNVYANDDEAFTGHSQAFGSSRKKLRSQRSFVHHGTSHVSRFSNSVAVRGGSHFESTRDAVVNRHWPEERFNGSYSHLNGGHSSGKGDWSHHLLDKRKTSLKPGKEHAMCFVKENRMHYSGPLLPQGGNIEDMLKEHERQIQHAVRKARLDKNKNEIVGNDNRQMELLLSHG